MFTATDVEGLKSLLENERKCKEDYIRVLGIRTEERDDLLKKCKEGNVVHLGASNVVQLTPSVIQRERKTAANNIIKTAMRHISQELGPQKTMAQRLNKVLEKLIAE